MTAQAFKSPTLANECSKPNSVEETCGRIPTPRLQSVLDDAQGVLGGVALTSALNGTPCRSRTSVERTVLERAALAIAPRPSSALQSRREDSSFHMAESAAQQEISAVVGPRELLRLRSRLSSSSPWAVHTENMSREAVDAKQQLQQQQRARDKAWVGWLDEEVQRRRREQEREREAKLCAERRSVEVLSLLERRQQAQLAAYKHNILQVRREAFEEMQHAARDSDEKRRLQIDAELANARRQAAEEAAKRQREEDVKRQRRVACASESIELALQRRRCLEADEASKCSPSPLREECCFVSEGGIASRLDRQRAEFEAELRRRRERVAARARSSLAAPGCRPQSRQEILQTRAEQAAVQAALTDMAVDRQLRDHEKAAKEAARQRLRLDLEAQALAKRSAKEKLREELLADGQARIERDRREKLLFESRLAELRQEQKKVIGEQLQLQMLQSLTAAVTAAAAGEHL
jgi:hypothetical protein